MLSYIKYAARLDVSVCTKTREHSVILNAKIFNPIQVIASLTNAAVSFSSEFWRLTLASFCRSSDIYYKGKSLAWYFSLSKYILKSLLVLVHSAYIAFVKDHLIVDHECYVNGLYVLAFSCLRKKVVTFSYPFGLVLYNFERLPRISYVHDLKNLKKYEHCLLIDSVEANQLKKTNYLRYLNSSRVPYLNLSSSDIDSNYLDSIHSNLIDCAFIVYAHSFTDAQNVFGFDGAFMDVKEWLEFTIDFLLSMDVKFCVKSHPNFYATGSDCTAHAMDRHIFESIYKKYSDKSAILWIDQPVGNSSLLEYLNSRTIAVSHHGTALIELGLSGFKCISSSSTLWRGYSIFNTWFDVQSYRHLLSSTYETLDPTNIDVLREFALNLYCMKSSYFHPDHWQFVVAKSLNVSRNEIVKRATLINGVNVQDVSSLIAMHSFQELC